MSSSLNTVEHRANGRCRADTTTFFWTFFDFTAIVDFQVVEEDEEFELLSTAPRFKLSVNRGLAKVAKGHQFMSATA